MDIVERFPNAVADLRSYVTLVKKWSPKINLIAASTYDEIWERHIADSAQLYDLLPNQTRTLVDLGSGAGFPVVVLAILAKHTKFRFRCVAVEADGRKSAFLRTVKRELGLDLDVQNCRIEAVAPNAPDVITARALADVSRLLGFAERVRFAGTTCLFPKGANVRNEVSDALKSWQFEPRYHPSVTSSDGAVLEIGEFKRA